MKTPAFWTSKNTLSNLLLPLSVLYEIGTTLYRVFIKPVTLPIPVICIGNLTAGGSGKTPVALHIGQLLKDRGIQAFFLSRGYGGTIKDPVLVDPEKHTARDVGDEPLLLAGLLPTVVAKGRLSGARFALQKGAQAIIMDDGFQNPSITKTLSLLVIDGRVGFGNKRLLPAGPLREDPESGLKRAHAVVVLNRTTIVPALPPYTPVLNGKTHPKDPTALKGKKLFAFCGIAYPQKFFDMLTSAGAQVIDKESFPDHYLYRESDIKKLIDRAHKKQAILVTTSKDSVRVPPALKPWVSTIEMTIDFDNAALLDSILDYILTLPSANEKN